VNFKIYIKRKATIYITDLTKDLVDAIANEDITVSLNTDYVKQDCTVPEGADHTIYPTINIEEEEQQEDDQVGSPAPGCAN